MVDGAWWHLLVLGVVAAPACGTAHPDADSSLGDDRMLGGGPAYCEVAGHRYAPGDSWRAEDGCNVYTCAPDGTSQVLLSYCEPSESAGSGAGGAGGAAGDDAGAM